MYSICIKFKDKCNWRPMCRQFESENACHDFVNEAFSRWPVKHVSVFVNGAFCNCFYMSPKRCAEIRASLEKLNSSKTRLFSHYAI